MDFGFLFSYFGVTLVKRSWALQGCNLTRDSQARREEFSRALSNDGAFSFFRPHDDSALANILFASHASKNPSWGSASTLIQRRNSKNNRRLVHGRLAVNTAGQPSIRSRCNPSNLMPLAHFAAARVRRWETNLYQRANLSRPLGWGGSHHRFVIRMTYRSLLGRSS